MNMKLKAHNHPPPPKKLIAKNQFKKKKKNKKFFGKEFKFKSFEIKLKKNFGIDIIFIRLNA